MTDRRRLVVLRHAKAEPFAASDHARRLTDRGVADAAAAGAHLAATGVVPDHAVVSTAARTRMTWVAVRDTSGSEAEAVFEDAVYHGDAEATLETLRTVPAAASTVLWVGHNPTAAELANLLDDGSGDEGAVSGMLRGFPTGALVVFEIDVTWAELAPETGRVVDFHVGRS